MASLPLNKSSLKLQRDQLRTYERFLPSLDLKRQQLVLEARRAARTLAATQAEIEEFLVSLDRLLPLVGSAEMDLSGLVRVQSLRIDEENLLGVKLPVLGDVEIEVQEYSMLAKPFWVDALVERLQEMARLDLRRQVDQQRLRRLEEALRRITQRVNLFDKVLIPSTKRNMHRISIYLTDAERAAVVRSKIVKGRR